MVPQYSLPSFQENVIDKYAIRTRDKSQFSAHERDTVCFDLSIRVVTRGVERW